MTYYKPTTDVASFQKQTTFSETKKILNQAVADLFVAHSILHQVHWYMRGTGFMIWHPKMDEYMGSLAGYLDEMSERLITLGGAPFSTLAEFSSQSQLTEVTGDFSLSMAEQLGRVLDVHRYLADLFTKGLEITEKENDSVTNDIFNVAKAEIEKTIWMLAAELHQTPDL